MDRLASYYAWNDPQSLKLALLVASKHDIDVAEVEEWSKKEHAYKAFETFLRRLKKFSQGR